MRRLHRQPGGKCRLVDSPMPTEGLRSALSIQTGKISCDQEGVSEQASRTVTGAFNLGDRWGDLLEGEAHSERHEPRGLIWALTVQLVHNAGPVPPS